VVLQKKPHGICILFGLLLDGLDSRYILIWK